MRLRIALSVLALSWLSIAAAAQAPAPCLEDERYSQLDFWVGEWRVFDAQGNEVGTNKVEKILEGCLVQETWSSAGSGSGRSMNFFDPAIGRWRQTWVDQQGGVVRYEGAHQGGVMQFLGESIGADGSRVVARAVLEPLADGRLRHFIEHSHDAGETWTTYFNGTYQRMGEQYAQAPAFTPTPVEAPRANAPATPTAPARPVEVSSAQGVTPVSTVVPEGQLPVEERNKIHLSSPMVLEVEVGPLDAIKDGYSWRTDETGVFISDGTTAREIVLTKRGRRGKVEVGVRVTLHTERFSRKVNVMADLLSVDGEVVGSVDFGKVALGKPVPAHDPDDGLKKEQSITLSRDAFDALFAGDESPKLRLTVTTL